ncbi:hypothetical protein B0T10DRAFT_169913 [Thelonectria olida]|uniref:Uncharacterized protein n=1 Tax=Thelonectria olida TaxID=1576542 RepID=A0A9P8WHH4_9HYPO|nr:hypothetical protein B0T10DRAFT_169913 [Thelonectria olida]
MLPLHSPSMCVAEAGVEAGFFEEAEADLDAWKMPDSKGIGLCNTCRCSCSCSNKVKLLWRRVRLGMMDGCHRSRLRTLVGACSLHLSACEPLRSIRAAGEGKQNDGTVEGSGGAPPLKKQRRQGPRQSALAKLVTPSTVQGSVRGGGDHLLWSRYCGEYPVPKTWTMWALWVMVGSWRTARRGGRDDGAKFEFCWVLADAAAPL